MCARQELHAKWSCTGDAERICPSYGQALTDETNVLDVTSAHYQWIHVSDAENVSDNANSCRAS
jgi:hypothetical protein